jgi:ribosome biogenesis GTPase
MSAALKGRATGVGGLEGSRHEEETTVYSLEQLGWGPFFDQQLTDDERARWAPARVVWEGREQYRIATGGAEWRAGLAGRVRHDAADGTLPAVGDWVLAALRPVEGAATIHRTLARRSRIARGAAGRATAEQVVAANVDTVLIVTSCNQDLNPRRLERYLAFVWDGGANPVVVVNKIDLCDDAASWRREIGAVAQGVPIVAASALRGDGMDAVAEVVRAGGTSVLAGSSGGGKSTILNALAGDERQTVRPIREADDRGRHSTTSRQLFVLADGGIVIDTPGMRELQLWDAADGLEHAFGDIDALAAGCRFRDCSHTGEPGCAVAAAADDGTLDPGRLDSYHQLRRENAFLQSRQDGDAAADRKRGAKIIARAQRLQEKLRRR